MEAEDAVRAVSPEEAVIDVDIGVAGGLQPVRRHRAGGFEDDRLGDVDAEGVPARPAHERTELRVARERDLRRIQQPRRARGHLVAARALQAAQVHVRLPGCEVDADSLVALRAFAELDAGVGGNSRNGNRGDQKRQASHFHCSVPLFFKRATSISFSAGRRKARKSVYLFSPCARRRFLINYAPFSHEVRY